MIHEVIVTTVNKDKLVHIAPMGIKFVNHANQECIQISPFKPSQTLDNLINTKKATVNFIDDVKVFAGIVTGRKKEWDLSPQSKDKVAHLFQYKFIYEFKGIKYYRGRTQTKYYL